MASYTRTGKDTKLESILNISKTNRCFDFQMINSLLFDWAIKILKDDWHVWNLLAPEFFQ